MATRQSTAEVISAAIEIINHQRQPLLKIVNGRGFHQTTPQQWATVHHLMGLNIMLHRLEETRKRYLQFEEVPVEDWPIARSAAHEEPSQAEIDRVVEDLLPRQQ